MCLEDDAELPFDRVCGCVCSCACVVVVVACGGDFLISGCDMRHHAPRTTIEKLCVMHGLVLLLSQNAAATYVVWWHVAPPPSPLSPSSSVSVI